MYSAKGQEKDTFFVVSIAKPEGSEKCIKLCLREVIHMRISPILVFSSFNPNSKSECVDLRKHVERLLIPNMPLVFLDVNEAQAIDSYILHDFAYNPILLNEFVDIRGLQSNPKHSFLITKVDAMAKEFILSQISCASSISNEENDDKKEE